MSETGEIKVMASEIAEKIHRINERLAAQEPDSVSVDTYGGYVGYDAQFIYDALNAEIGIGNWGFKELDDKSQVINIEKGQLAVTKVQFWIDGVKWQPDAWGQCNVTRGAVGDARKGAITDAVKKAASVLGIGSAAYRGELEKWKEEKNSKQQQSARPPQRPQQPQKQSNPTSIPTQAQVEALTKQLFPSRPFAQVAGHYLKEQYEEGKELTPEQRRALYTALQSVAKSRKSQAS